MARLVEGSGAQTRVICSIFDLKVKVLNELRQLSAVLMVSLYLTHITVRDLANKSSFR